MGLVITFCALKNALCPDCGGDGYSEDHTGADACKTCSGCGQIEVCDGCKKAPWVDEEGYETCDCVEEWTDEDLAALIQDELESNFWGEAA